MDSAKTKASGKTETNSIQINSSQFRFANTKALNFTDDSKFNNETNSTQFNPYQFRFTWHSKGRKHFALAKSTLAFRVPLSKSPVLRMKPWPNSIRIHHSQFKAQFTLDFRMPLLRSPVHRTKHWPNSIQFPNSKINYPNTKSGQ